MARKPSTPLESAVRWLERHEPSTISVRDLHRGPCNGKGTVDTAHMLADILEMAGAIRLLPSPREPRPGRPTRLYAVNPSAKRLAEEKARDEAAKRAIKQAPRAASELYVLTERLQDVLAAAHRAEQDQDARRAYALAGEHYRAMRDYATERS